MINAFHAPEAIVPEGPQPVVLENGEAVLVEEDPRGVDVLLGLAAGGQQILRLVRHGQGLLQVLGHLLLLVHQAGQRSHVVAWGVILTRKKKKKGTKRSKEEKDEITKMNANFKFISI